MSIDTLTFYVYVGIAVCLGAYGVWLLITADRT